MAPTGRPLPGRLVLLGHPVSHSLSPTFQQAALDHLKIPLRYEAIDVAADALEATLKQLKSERAAGNVTLPHKARVAALCDSWSDIAKRAAAVNTFWVDERGALVGDNTDVGGFQYALRQLLGSEAHEIRVLILGAGGAAAGAVASLAEFPGAKVTIHARNAAAASALNGGAVQSASSREHSGAESARHTTKNWLGVTDGSDAQLASVLGEVDLIVNATSLGIEGQDELPLAADRVPKHCAALDLTYRRSGPTPWVAALRARGIRADDGITMLLEQGALAFERWFGVEAPRAVMARALGR